MPKYRVKLTELRKCCVTYTVEAENEERAVELVDEEGLGDEIDEEYLERWMDGTAEPDVKEMT